MIEDYGRRQRRNVPISHLPCRRRCRLSVCDLEPYLIFYNSGRSFISASSVLHSDGHRSAGLAKLRWGGDQDALAITKTRVLLNQKLGSPTPATRVWPIIVHDGQESSPANIDDDFTQLHLLQSAWPDRAVPRTKHFFETRKPRTYVLQSSQITRSSTKIKNPSSPFTDSGPSSGRQAAWTQDLFTPSPSRKPG
ncbi:hypothetical protein AXF42_Ash019706 [Apostasia shenzhenica]|uniref:Uncharacterized protein n=1 Tax=Apostasia shenzhenica TaxID=1088818 RepID=A0A2H9ZTW0_9ASPA|nr:hypothetical protein AXF42_Ash019706 [Apostasia shenzhenica]